MGEFPVDKNIFTALPGQENTTEIELRTSELNTQAGSTATHKNHMLITFPL